MARSKIHHQVPKTLQKRFLDRNGQIWYSERSKGEDQFRTIENRSIESTFKDRDFYTIIDEQGSPSDVVERNFFGPADDLLGKLLSEIEIIFSNGKIPEFLGVPKKSMDHLLCTLMLRTKDISHPHDDLETGREILSDIFTNTEQAGLEIEEGALGTFSKPKALGRHVRTLAQTTYPNSALSELSKYRVHFAQTGRRSSFILGSRMVYHVHNGSREKLGHPSVELWLPISPKLAMVYCHRDNTKIPSVETMDRKWVRSFNILQVNRSLQLGAHSGELLSWLTGAKIKRN